MQTTLEHMTIWGLISDAGPVVKAVMLTLLLASLVSWYLIVQRQWVLAAHERQLRQFQQQFRASTELGAVYRAQTPVDSGVQPVFRAGYEEFVRLNRHGTAAEVVLEGSERALAVAITEQELRLEKGLAFLATVGSVSPYIGLFGTVWGIMGAFIGLSQAQQATLSTVAPGIAEALIATAIGLFAAIPAVVAYNRFAARGQTLLTRYYNFANELQVRLHRQLHGASLNIAAAA